MLQIVPKSLLHRNLIVNGRGRIVRNFNSNFYLAVCTVVPTILIGLALSTRLARTWDIASITRVGGGRAPTEAEGKKVVVAAATIFLLTGAAAIGASLIGLATTLHPKGVAETTLILGVLFLLQATIYGVLMVTLHDSKA